jgi:hypothetical protein
VSVEFVRLILGGASVASAPDTVPDTVPITVPADEQTAKPVIPVNAMKAARTEKTLKAVKAVKTEGRFAKLTKSCSLFDQPQAGANKLNEAPSGQRLWTEPSVKRWSKVFRRSGVAYIADDCFGGASVAPVAVAPMEMAEASRVVPSKGGLGFGAADVERKEHSEESFAAPIDLASSDDGLLAEYSDALT